jgi:hypothetical protein
MELQVALLGLFPIMFYFFLVVRRFSSQGFYLYCILETTNIRFLSSMKLYYDCFDLDLETIL